MIGNEMSRRHSQILGGSWVVGNLDLMRRLKWDEMLATYSLERT